MIILGAVLALLGYFFAVPIVMWIGVAVLAVGVVFAVAGATGHAVAGRRHYY